MLSLFAWLLNTFLLPKGLPDKGFKKLYYCDFPCSFILPSSNMKRNIMPLHCAVPPPLTWVGCSCQATIVSYPWRFHPNSWRSGPWWRTRDDPKHPPVWHVTLRKHPRTNRSHRAARTWIFRTQTHSLTQGDQHMRKSNFSKGKFCFPK